MDEEGAVQVKAGVHCWLMIPLSEVVSVSLSKTKKTAS